MGVRKRMTLAAAWELTGAHPGISIPVSRAQAVALLWESGIPRASAQGKADSFTGPILLRRVVAGEVLWRYCNHPEAADRQGRFLTPNEYRFREDADLALALLPQFTDNDAKIKQRVRCIAPDGALVLDGNIRHAEPGILSLVRVKVDCRVITRPTVDQATQAIWLGLAGDFSRSWAIGEPVPLPSRIPSGARTPDWIAQARERAGTTLG